MAPVLDQESERRLCICTWASRCAVPHREILGIFDLDNASWAYKTREFLERAEQEGRVISVCDDLPRSFVLVGEEKGTATVYISQLSSAALLRRAESNLL